MTSIDSTKFDFILYPVFCLFSVLVSQHFAMAQDLPVLKANSRTVDIQDGDRLFKGGWTITPSVELDVHNALRTTEEKTITFSSDIDSLSFKVRPGCTYDFIILLDGEDKCHTRITTMLQGFKHIEPGTAAGPTTIPITIQGGKLHLQGKVNDSMPLDFIFDTGADASALFPSAMNKKVDLHFDGTTSNIGTGGVTQRQTSSDNRLEVSGLRWDNELILYVEKQADDADGIIGYPVFQGKVVEIDYDRMVMIVHDALPAHASKYVKSPMTFVGSLTAVEVNMVHGETESSGRFRLDTGGAGTMNVNQAYDQANSLRSKTRHLGTSTSHGVGSGTIRNDIVIIPELRLAGFALPNVPIHVELPSDGESAPPGGTLNMEVLKRFNTFLEYQRNEAYFKPNTLFDAPFPNKGKFSGPPWFLFFGTAAISIVVLAGIGLLLVKRFRRPIGSPSG